MKKIVRNLFAVIAATALVGSIVSCADSDAEDPFAPVSTNSNAASGSGGETTGGDKQGAGKAKYTNNEITFPVTVASTNDEDTVLLIKYDRSAAGADELIKITKAGLKVWKNGTEIKTFDTIEFALDEYGATFDDSDKDPIKNDNNKKEYKVKLSIGTTVAKGDSIKVKLDEKAFIEAVGTAAANVKPESVVVALIDKAESAGYYKELCENSDLYKPFLTKNEEAVAPQGGNTESKAEGSATSGQEASGNGENSRPAGGANAQASQTRSISGAEVEFTVANDKASSVSESSPVCVILQYTRANPDEAAIKIDPAELKIFKGEDLVKTVTKIEGFSLNVWGGSGNAFEPDSVQNGQPMDESNCKCFQIKIPLETVTSVSGEDKIKVHLVSGTVVGSGSNLAEGNLRASIGVGDDSLNGWSFTGIVTSDSAN